MKQVNNQINELTLNSIISKQQSSFNNFQHDNFSSLLNQEENSKEQEEELSSEFDSQQQVLMNQAYLNKIFISSVA